MLKIFCTLSLITNGYINTCKNYLKNTEINSITFFGFCKIKWRFLLFKLNFQINFRLFVENGLCICSFNQILLLHCYIQRGVEKENLLPNYHLRAVAVFILNISRFNL